MVKRISKEETLLILRSIKHSKRNDLRCSSSDSTDYYLLDDGRLLLDFKNADFSTFFENEAEYKKYMGEASNEGHYILEGFPSDTNEFINSIEKSMKQLEKFLQITQLDFSFNSLKEIDRTILKNAISYEFYFDHLFKFLVVYVSNTIIIEMKAKWHFLYNEKENVMEPFLKLPNGKNINVFIDLYEEALEHFDDFSVYYTALLRLDKSNL